MIADVEVREAGSKGRGVFARRRIARGEFIFRRRHGRVVDSDAIMTLSPEDRMHLCELDWDRFAVLLPPGCYLNHSCDPNAMRSGVKVFAWKMIRAGEEITIGHREHIGPTNR
ncbi:MAG: SET domain-containing methyltransferase [Dehalococcoidia bacterium]